MIKLSVSFVTVDLFISILFYVTNKSFMLLIRVILKFSVHLVRVFHNILKFMVKKFLSQDYFPGGPYDDSGEAGNCAPKKEVGVKDNDASTAGPCGFEGAISGPAAVN